MTRKNRLAALALPLALACLPGGDVRADVPRRINFQGRLADASGTPLDGPFELVFRIFDAPTLGTTCFTETQLAVPVNDGLFNVDVGAVAAGGITGCNFAIPYYLEVQVGTDQPMAPRSPLMTVAFAFNADRLDGLDSTQLLRVDAVTGNVVVGGKLGVSTTTPSQRVDVVGRAKATQMCIGAACRTTWPTGTVSSVTASTGVTLSTNPLTTTGSVSVNTGVVQQRVGGACTSTQTMGSIGSTGTPTCNAASGSVTCSWGGLLYTPGAICRSGTSAYTCQTDGTFIITGASDPLNALPTC